jgi:hypothetical protein
MQAIERALARLDGAAGRRARFRYSSSGAKFQAFDTGTDIFPFARSTGG